MDDPAGRVNPVPLHALLRRREARERAAAGLVRDRLAATEAARDAERAACQALDRHEQRRRAREAAALRAAEGQCWPAQRIWALRDELEAMARSTTRLEGERTRAIAGRQSAEDELERSRQVLARRARELRTWEAAVNRVEAARRVLADAAAEGEAEDEAGDRYARRAVVASRAARS